MNGAGGATAPPALMIALTTYFEINMTSTFSAQNSATSQAPTPPPSATPPPPGPIPAPAVTATTAFGLPTAAPMTPTEVTLSFAGLIQHPASKNLRNACCGAVNNGAAQIQILFSSNGGSVDEGFSLYHFLRSLPVKLIMHCVGSADSIATVVFLAGAERYCCADATFLFHDYALGWPTPVNFTRQQFDEFHTSLEGFVKRSQGLLKTRAAFTDQDFTSLQLYDKPVVYNAHFAKQKGIVHDIRDPVVPARGPIWNVEY